MMNGWDTFNALFGINGTNQAILFNSGGYGKSDAGPASGIAGTVLPNEEDFLTEEPGCIPPPPPPGTVYDRNSPVNCASMGGKTGP